MNRFSRVTEYLLYIIIILIPFSIRHVFESVWNYKTGAYSDFTSLSLYASDIIFGCFIVISLVLHMKQPTTKLPKIWKYAAIGLVFWLLIQLIINTSDSLPLQSYFTVRLISLILFCSIISRISVSREKIAWTFTLLGVLQAILGTAQFYMQKSLGLHYIGESHLGPTIEGVAKIVSHGTTYNRGYGTFPHSNLLAAFLVVSIAFNLYLIAKSYQIPRGVSRVEGKWSFSRETIALYILLAANLFGLFISFSRAGILGVGILGLVSLICFTWNKYWRRIFEVTMPLGVLAIIVTAILWPNIMTRATVSDNATKERVFYNNIGLEMVKNKPFFGFGAGTSVLHMKQYAKEVKNVTLESWEIQPIHNYYLIGISELGIGDILLLILVIYPILILYKRKNDLWIVFIGSVGIAFLALFMLDHYFYTIWPTQLLLWLILGLILNSWHNKEPIYDTLSQK